MYRSLIPKYKFARPLFLETAYYVVFAMSIVFISCVTAYNFVDGLYTPKLIAFFVFCALTLILSYIIRVCLKTNVNKKQASVAISDTNSLRIV